MQFIKDFSLNSNTFILKTNANKAINQKMALKKSKNKVSKNLKKIQRILIILLIINRIRKNIMFITIHNIKNTKTDYSFSKFYVDNC